MPICPRGHESQAEDWCDFCGFPMTPPSPIPPPPGTLPGVPGGQGGPGTHGAPGAPGAYGVPGAPEGHGGQPGYPGQHGHPGHGGDPFGGPVTPGPVAPAAAPQAPQGFPDLTEGLVVCPICRSPQTGRFCEECGYDYELSAPSRRQHPAPAAGHAPPQAPAPLNIPAAYGGPQSAPPQAHPQQGHPQQPHPQAAPQPHPQAHPQQPHQQQQAGHGGAPSGYGYPPPAPNPAPGPGYPEQQPQQPQRDDSGPVYAQPGPTGRGEEFGTSFNLAPPVPQPGQQPGQQAPPEPVRTNWIAVVSADRDYFTDMMARSGPEAAGLFFPPYCPERRIPITGRGQLRIGRRSQHRGTVPEIDLSVAPEDPGASHQHALLAEQADGSWVLVDQDSTNGTTVNGGAEPITPHTAIPLNDGDRIHVGAWTTITLHRA
ncbi:FHA domain-containing protein [Kitasatospora sp. NPDC048239]|uniref:FHA domain-containing protein n=1 Tax=Kitasatospora sp. NPDC048239 TaxID=3364046 RepID=UPI003721A261